MTEDMQTGGIQQSSQSVGALQVGKRLHNVQLEGDKSRYSNAGALSKQQNRKQKQQKHNNKREVTLQGGHSKGKKYNCNADSLLNFDYISSRSYVGTDNISSNYRTQRRRRPTFNKETFLQANCKFVVDWDQEKYIEQTIDPDILVDWNVIQLVYLPTHENPKCPICLFPPSAAKMTRCGHVYCWSCILHYLTLSDKSWHKCPICHEAVHEKDLKSVIPIIQKKFSRIDDITLKLMVRPRDSLCAFPYSELQETVDPFPIWQGQPFNYSSSKLLLANPETVVENILLRERTELTAQMSEAVQESTGEDLYVRMALEKLQEKLSSYSEYCPDFSPVEEPVKKESPPLNGDGSYQLAQLLKDTKSSQTSTGFYGEEAGSNATDGDKVVNDVVQVEEEEVYSMDDMKGFVVDGESGASYRDRSRSSISSSKCSDELMGDFGSTQDPRDKRDDCYYFYQAEDGQNIFINSLNARCLMEEYGSLKDGPEKIVGQILDFECYTMTPELRKRFRYLGHLPLSCEFITCELMLRPPILSKHTIHNFMPEFNKRKALRLRKSEKQRKFDMKAQAEQSRQAGFRVSDDIYTESPLNLSDVNDFPTNLSPEEVEDRPEEPDDKSSGGGGPSFAQMLKNPSMAVPSSNVGAGAWGKTKKPSETVPYFPALAQHNPASYDSDDNEDGPNLVAPTLQAMFSAATLSIHTEPSNANSGGDKKNGKRGGGKGKKKAKGTLLFVTGAQRKY